MLDLTLNFCASVRGEMPETVEGVLELLGLARWLGFFKEHEFLPQDLFLATDGYLMLV